MMVFMRREGEPLRPQKEGISVGAESYIVTLILNNVLSFQSHSPQSGHDICFLFCKQFFGTQRCCRPSAKAILPCFNIQGLEAEDIQGISSGVAATAPF